MLLKKENIKTVLFEEAERPENITMEWLDEAELAEKQQDSFVKIMGERQNCPSYIGAQSFRRGRRRCQRDSGIEDLRG